MNNKKFYVTTPIYYVNASPHLGTLYSTLLADVAARWNILQGEEVFLLTGTDEHGQKIAEAAGKAGKEPQEFVDSFVPAYKALWRSYNIDYTYFIRTTDRQHMRAVQLWITKLLETGDIYKSYYNGWYCVSCETFVAEKNSKTEAPSCESCGRIARELTEESYFFKLSAYQDRLLAFYNEHPDFITPAERMQEVINFVQDGLHDLSISRTTVKWGIPFPGDSAHVTYVWADALNNYITAVGYADEDRCGTFEKWWPADLQVLGKDIIRFHAIYWPAFLIASELLLPKKLLVHGWIKIGEAKMSKSLGNAIDPYVLMNTYGVDPIRYYLVRHMAITHDASFSIDDLKQRSNSDLADDLGNLLNRMLTLAKNYNITSVRGKHIWGLAEQQLRQELLKAISEMQRELRDYYFHRAYDHLWKFIHKINSYFHLKEPWKLAKIDSDDFCQVLSATCHSLHAVALLAWPLMPQSMELLLISLGTPYKNGVDHLEKLSGEWDMTFILEPRPPLFAKYV
jgi:methionyl-tRNA synthetase